MSGTGLRLTGELVSVAAGSATRAPADRDRRFSDPAWGRNPFYRRLLPGYLAVAETVDDAVGRFGLEPESVQRARFVTSQLIDAPAPATGW